MNPLFIAGFAYANDDGEVLMTGLADHQYETRNCILFQKTIHPTAQDKQLGLDDVHLTVNSQDRSCYGGVKQMILQSGLLLLRVSPEAAKALGTDQDIRIAIPKDLSGMDGVASSLQRMFTVAFSDQR